MPMRVVVVASDRELTGGGLLADRSTAAAEQALQVVAATGGSPPAEAVAEQAIDRITRILFDQWRHHRRAQVRIGSYESLGKVSQISSALQETFGRRALLLPSGADSVTIFRIAVEVPVTIYAKTMEAF